MIQKLRGVHILLFLAVSSLSLDAQSIPNDSLYLGQTPPGNTPQVFAPGIISISGRRDKVITFSPDGQCLFFSVGIWPNCSTMFMEYKNNHWTNPVTASFSKTRSVDEPSFSPDGKRVYYYAYPPGSSNNSDICYSEKQDTIWSDPINVGSPVNSSSDEYHPCIVNDSSIYFENSSGVMYRSQYLNGTYQSPIELPPPINPNSAYGDLYVSLDESYIVFSSTRSGYGGNDIYISYKKADGTWTNPKNLGNTINTSASEYDADVTPDGKYMTFGRNDDIYWVRVENLIDSLKHTVIPYLKTQIPNLTDTVGRLLIYTIPDTTFSIDDRNNTLTYTSTLSNGSPLPTWLLFDSTSKTFFGRPTTTGTFTIKVTATDNANSSVSCQFTITVVASLTDVEKVNNQLPRESVLLQNYPNPFNPTTTVSFEIGKQAFVTIRVYDVLGRELATLVNEQKNTGSYRAIFDGSNLSSGIYFVRLTVQGSDAKPFIKTITMQLVK